MRKPILRRLLYLAATLLLLWASRPGLAAHREKIGAAFAAENPTLAKMGGQWLYPRTVRLQDRFFYTVGTVDGEPVSYGVLGVVLVTGEVGY
jgi:hypothetical protein